MQLDLMIEGQEGVTWPQWQALAGACEEHGIGTLFRSDHYLNLDGQHPERGSLDALATVIALSAQTTKLRLGTMVSPATFRHPSELAKLVTTADHVSGGRVELGLGAGWHEREHAAYGFTYPELRERMEILDEQLQIVLGNWSDGEFSFSGGHYRLERLDAQPKPVQRPHPPLLMGGGAGPLAARLAASYADEYNTAFAGPAAVRERREKIAAACERAGREPIPFSVMGPLIAGRDEADLRARATRSAQFRDLDPEQLLRDPPEGFIVGTLEQVAERLREYEAAGAFRVLCQHQPHDDLDFVELLGRELAPMVA
ncbi:MAG TPA: TIGR03560 family F420-dependent LLM class oxidoreductase [Solirubrobacteraceae bacterium]|jgi:F420-dependent oxidoreductase-like protein|nr:TIGR03560 family F420-dependent LLM class oxidoreductase [Solirubrobacteraceae bacterium]